MTWTPHLRKIALTAHVATSVGWFGAVASFLALAIAGLCSSDTHTVRAAYAGMAMIAWFVIVPLGLASPLTGILQSLTTTWGLFRHYWILVKFLITIPATAVLLVHLQPIGHMARLAAETTIARGEFAAQRIQLVASASAALLVLLLATFLSVLKPWGIIPYAKRKRPGVIAVSTVGSPQMRIAWGVAIVIVLLFLIMHLITGGHGSH